MGQVDSKRPMPSIQVQSPHTAHLPEKPRTPTPSKALLNVPTNRVRRKSVDTGEVSRSFEEKDDFVSDKPIGVEKKKDSASSARGGSRSPFFPKRKMGTKSGSEFFLPLVVPGWLEQLPVQGRRSRRPSEETGPINMKSILRPFSPSKSNESWDDDGLPKIPANEIFNPPKSDEDSDDEECQPQQFRGRASTIGNGQIPRLARAPNIQRGTSVKKTDNSLKIPVVLRFNATNLQKCPSHVYVAGSMTDWKSVEMVRLKGEKDFKWILDCSPGKYFYKFFVNNEWRIDESQPISSYLTRKQSATKGSKLAKANVIKVKQADKEVFEALACDSFSIKKLDINAENDSWSQNKPKTDTNVGGPGTGGPPILPPQPSTHVMLNHLYAQSIRENLLVMATTTRYKKKCVTIVYYKPLDD